ncbi:MAG: hypothetical protein ACU83P_07525, partial [Gammaproteobacteria bacterium]
MKPIKSATVALFLMLPVSMAAQAENPSATPEAKPSMEMPKGKGMGMQHGKGAMGGMTEEQKEQHLKMMQEHMLQMHDLSNRILAETDPAKKEQLKTEQLQLMKAHHQKEMMHRMERMQQHR